MESEKTDRLGELNGYQIAALALIMSTLAALGTLFALRRSGLVRSHDVPLEAETQPAVPHVPLEGTPDHFSEELLVPGITHTGKEIAEQDGNQGRSPEGV